MSCQLAAAVVAAYAAICSTILAVSDKNGGREIFLNRGLGNGPVRNLGKQKKAWIAPRLYTLYSGAAPSGAAYCLERNIVHI